MSENLLQPSYGLSNTKLQLATTGTGDVLSGKTFYSGDKTLKTGTMTNRGAWGSSVAAGGSVTIPAGYHNGSGKVTASKGTLHRKDLTKSVNAWMGSFTYNVISSFGIPSNIAGSLSASNFVGYIKSFNMTKGVQILGGLQCTVSYNSGSHVLTVNYTCTDYAEFTTTSVIVSAFWVS